MARVVKLVVECANPRMQGYNNSTWGPECFLYVWLGPVGPTRIFCTRMPTTAEQMEHWRAVFALPIDRALEHANLELELVRHNVVSDVGTSSRLLIVGQGTVTDVGMLLARAPTGVAEGRLELRRRIGNDWIEGSIHVSIWLANLPVY